MTPVGRAPRYRVYFHGMMPPDTERVHVDANVRSDTPRSPVAPSCVPVRRGRRGFTLVELLVVIAIIGILATIAVVAVNNAREKAKEVKAEGDLSQLRTAISLLEQDTGKWPDGCPAWQVKNPEVDLATSAAGIVAKPSVHDYGGGCEWTTQDLANWNGPYMLATKDPWGNDYYFDPDYTPRQNCSSATTGAEGVFVLSFGPNGVGVNAYDCDDIYLKLR